MRTQVAKEKNSTSKNPQKAPKKSAKGKPQPRVKPTTKNEPKTAPKPKQDDKDSTTKKIKGGPGMMNGETGRKFSKDYQPSREAKKAGIVRAKTLRELLSMPLKSKLPDTEEEFIQQVMRTYQVKREEVDLRLFMEMKLAERAYKYGDAIAYKALLDRALGKPMTEQPPVIETPQGEKSFISLPNGIQIEI